LNPSLARADQSGNFSKRHNLPFLTPREAGRMAETVDDILAQVAILPLADAAYALWRQKVRFEQLEHRYWPPKDLSTPEATEKSIQESRAEIKYEHDFAQDGPTFGKLKRTHPLANDAQRKAVIIAAVKFDDDCFGNLKKDGAKYWEGDYWENITRAVAQAARDHPGYLEITYRDARNRVAYYMK
jgi:hypothetical protein